MIAFQSIVEKPMPESRGYPNNNGPPPLGSGPAHTHVCVCLYPCSRQDKANPKTART